MHRRIGGKKWLGGGGAVESIIALRIVVYERLCASNAIPFVV
jgi:hypothetical protein